MNIILQIIKKIITNKKIRSRLKLIRNKCLEIYLNRSYYIPSNKINRIEYNHKKNEYAKLENSLVECIHRYSDIMTKIDTSKSIFGTTLLENVCFISNNGDEMGKVFSYNGEIYRGIYKDSLFEFLNVWNTGVLQVLGQKGFLPLIEISDFYMEEFPLILKTEKVNILSHITWTYAMVKDACILISVLKNILNRCGCTLLDGHLNNITFHMNHPMFIDIGSIIKFRETAYQDELVFAGGYKLLFSFLGNCMLNRLPSHDNNNPEIFIKPRFYNTLTREYQLCLKKFKSYYLFHGNILGLNLVHKIYDLHIIQPEYFDLLFPVCKESNIEDKYSNCFKDIYNTINELKGMNSLVTIGAYGGKLERTLIQETHIKNIKTIDFDERRLDADYLKLRDIKADISLYLYNYIYAQNGNILNQIKSDIVICIDPLTNIATYQNTSISSIIRSLNKLTYKYLVIVLYFGHVIHPLIRIQNNLTVEEKEILFEKALLKEFKIIKKYTSNEFKYVMYLAKI